MSDTGSRIIRYYGDFRGIDLRGEECALVRSPDCKNVWRNYKDLASIETRPGLKLEHTFPTENEGEALYRVLFFKDKLVAITNYGMYTTNGNEEFKPIQENKHEYFKIRIAFEFGDYLYFMHRGGYYRYDGTAVEKVDPYVPTTSIGRTPKGEGTTYQDVNLLTNKRINEFTADGVSVRFYLDTTELRSDYNYEYTRVYNIETGEQFPSNKETFVFDMQNNAILFQEAPPKSTTGRDNIRIVFRAGPDQQSTVYDNTHAQVFDNRVFLGGSKETPNRIWYSQLEAPNYFSDLDYCDDGVDSAMIKGMVPGNNALWVFREPSDTNTNVFYHVPSIDEQEGKIYPSAHSSVSLGCVGGAINFNDDIAFFSPNGMEGISADITTEQFASHRSSAVDRLMTAHSNYKEMLLEEWNGYLLVIMGNEVYLADSRAKYDNEGHMEYEWYYWDLSNEIGDKATIICSTVHDGVLYVGTDKCEIYSLTDTSPERKIHSYWTTPKDKFNSPNKTKTTNKRGCVVEGEGDIKVWAKTEDTEYQPVGEFTGIKDYLVPRIKQKKFKDLQLKFESDTSFKLENVTIEAVVGGYIKR